MSHKSLASRRAVSRVRRPAPLIETDPRRAKRTRTYLRGRLVFGRGYYTVDCTIWDLSEKGARVKVSPGATTFLPARLYLVHMKSYAAFESTVRWQRPDGDIGLKFTAIYDLQVPKSAESRALRRHCVDGLPSLNEPGLL